MNQSYDVVERPEWQVWLILGIILLASLALTAALIWGIFMVGNFVSEQVELGFQDYQQQEVSTATVPAAVPDAGSAYDNSSDMLPLGAAIGLY